MLKNEKFVSEGGEFSKKSGDFSHNLFFSKQIQNVYVTPQNSTPEDWGERKEKRIKRMLIERNN